jgi:hypothetical protein
MKKLVFLMIVFMLVPSITALSGEQQHLYSWDIMEMDRIASIWLIKRFVDPKATFRFYPRDTMQMDGIQIDTPLSKFRRTHRMTAYETLLKAHKLSDPSLIYIGQLVRDVEINIWGKKVLPETQGIDLVMKGVVLKSGDAQECVEKGFLVLDALYRALETRK